MTECNCWSTNVVSVHMSWSVLVALVHRGSAKEKSVFWQSEHPERNVTQLFWKTEVAKKWIILVGNGLNFLKMSVRFMHKFSFCCLLSTTDADFSPLHMHFKKGCKKIMQKINNYCHKKKNSSVIKCNTDLMWTVFCMAHCCKAPEFRWSGRIWRTKLK